MRERPILFSGPMVRAILDGRKTQTRRAVKPQPEHIEWFEHQKGWCGRFDPGHRTGLCDYQMVSCSYGQPGDRLWVRETFFDHGDLNGFAHEVDERVEYRATPWLRDNDEDAGGWQPSIHMPRWASRLTLEITGIRVERLNSISEEDAIAEGVTAPWMGHDRWDYKGPRNHREAFALIWDRINGKRGFEWSSNPWVWVIEFRACGDVS